MNADAAATVDADAPQETICVDVDILRPLGITVDGDLVVEEVGATEDHYYGRRIKPGHKVLAVGGYAVSNGYEFKEAVRQLQQTISASDEGKLVVPLLLSTGAEEGEEFHAFGDDDVALAAEAPPTLDHQLTREEMIVEGKARLEGRLEKMGLREVVMEDDGNCQVGV